MELRELNEDERITLVALLEMVVASNRDVTLEELAQIKHVIHALGENAYRAAVTEADRRFADDDAARAFLLTIERQEARELIYETALEAAMAESIGPKESDLLTWLAEQWKVPIRFARTDDES
jgi:hypothetical protein